MAGITLFVIQMLLIVTSECGNISLNGFNIWASLLIGSRIIGVIKFVIILFTFEEFCLIMVMQHGLKKEWIRKKGEHLSSILDIHLI